VRHHQCTARRALRAHPTIKLTRHQPPLRDERATEPEQVSRLFVARANAGDAAGMAELYEPDAVLAWPPGSQTVGCAAIQAMYEQPPARRDVAAGD
jgi:hypothetical protein